LGLAAAVPCGGEDDEGEAGAAGAIVSPGDDPRIRLLTSGGGGGASSSADGGGGRQKAPLKLSSKRPEELDEFCRLPPRPLPPPPGLVQQLFRNVFGGFRCLPYWLM
jgi:hypothetical protein